MTIATKATFAAAVGTPLSEVVTYATYDRVVPKEGDWDGSYRVTLRKSDNLSTSEVKVVKDMKAAHALLKRNKAVYVKNFRVAAALEEARAFAQHRAVEDAATEDVSPEGDTDEVA